MSRGRRWAVGAVAAVAVVAVAGVKADVLPSRHRTSGVGTSSAPAPLTSATRPTAAAPVTAHPQRSVPPSSTASRTHSPGTAPATSSTEPSLKRSASSKPTSTLEPSTTAAPKTSPKRASDAPSIRYVPTDTVTHAASLGRAVGYAKSHGGYRVGLAVFDTATGRLYGAGLDRAKFATESVVKAFIATRLLATHRMTPVRKAIAYKMITQSDDASGTALYGAAGGDGLVPWIERHYGLDDVGAPPTRAGWWGNTHITAVGMVRFYAAVRKDPAVWPWLSHAMHQARSHGSDGTYQFFGLKQADPHAAIKQGWGQDDDDWRASSDFNSTGFVGNDRYAVAILLKGPHWQYRTGSPAMVSSVAKKLMPGGHVDLG